MNSAAASPFTRWLDARVDAAPLRRFRVGFALVWLVYDVLDLAFAGTARCTQPFEASIAPLHNLVTLQSGLVAAQLLLLFGRYSRTLLLMCAALRGLEAYQFLRLNDFYYYTITAFLLALCDTGHDARSASRWPRDVLRWQTAWIYAATALMKMNPEWLSGGHLFVRQQYNQSVLHWPYPGFYQRCTASLGCNSVHAWMGVLSELTLSVLLFTGRARWFAVLLCAGIHGFGAVATNVWFFGPSIFLQVFFLTIDRPPPPEPAASDEA